MVRKRQILDFIVVTIPLTIATCSTPAFGVLITEVTASARVEAVAIGNLARVSAPEVCSVSMGNGYTYGCTAMLPTPGPFIPPVGSVSVAGSSRAGYGDLAVSTFVGTQSSPGTYPLPGYPPSYEFYTVHSEGSVSTIAGFSDTLWLTGGTGSGMLQYVVELRSLCMFGDCFEPSPTYILGSFPSSAQVTDGPFLGRYERQLIVTQPFTFEQSIPLSARIGLGGTLGGGTNNSFYDLHSLTFLSMQIIGDEGLPLSGFQYRTESNSSYNLAGSTFVATPEPPSGALVLAALIGLVMSYRARRSVRIAVWVCYMIDDAGREVASSLRGVGQLTRV